MVYFYSDFINKLICAGRNDGTEPFFRLDVEIDRDDFVKFSNRFIENYYATVPPDFARNHPMVFSFGAIDHNGQMYLNRALLQRDLEKYPAVNGGILFLDSKDDGAGDGHKLDASVFRQACFIQREQWKFRITLGGAVLAVIAIAINLAFRK